MKVKQSKFWILVTEYFNEYLPKVRRMSNGTIETYKYGLYAFADFLVKKLEIQPQDISFDNFTREIVKKYVSWMSNEAGLANATCNLKMT